MAVYTVKTAATIYTDFYNGRKLARMSNGRLWCAYWFIQAGQDVIGVSYSDDGGLTWTENVVFSYPARDLRAPALAVDSLDQLHLIYNRIGVAPLWANRILYRKYSAGVWGAEETAEDINASDPAIAIDSNDNINITYQAFHPVALASNIRYRQKSSAGAWLLGVWLSEQPTAWWGQYYPAIAIDLNDDVHIAWQGTDWGANPDKYNIQYRRTLAGIWQPREAITDLPAHQYHPSIAIDNDDNVHLGWAYNANYRVRTIAGWQPLEVMGNFEDLNLSIDQSGIPYVVGEHTDGGVTQIEYSRRVAGVWTPQQAVTSTLVNNSVPITIWAKHPTVSGIKTNVPLTGCAVLFYTWAAPMECNYSPLLLTWPPPACSSSRNQ